MKIPIKLQMVVIIAIMRILFSTTPGFWQAAKAVHFDHAKFDNPNLPDIEVIDINEDPWYTGQRAQEKGDGIWLTPDPRDGTTNYQSNIGRVVYKDPILFSSTTSFRTSFSFQIITTSKNETCGSGFAFFIQASKKAPAHSKGRYLGLFNPNATPEETRKSNFFAVEFDTHLSPDLQDSSASHIGIDINSLKSVSHADSNNETSGHFPQLFLYNNYSFTVWVEYSASSNLTQVWMINSNTTAAPILPPSLPILTDNHSLYSIFEDQPFVYIGFSAANNASEDGMQGAVLLSWRFTDDTHGKINLLGLVIGSCFGLVMMLAITFFVLKYNFNSMRVYGGCDGISHPDTPGPIQRQYRLKELKKATNNFSKENEIGRGAFSIVYRGIQPDGSIMAVKKLNQGVRKEDEFASAMRIISTCRHKNILELQGWYYGKREAMLVYKFMENSSLDEYLYGSKESMHVLSSEVRLRILEEVSLALGYMHTDLDECVLHRDVKAANVLLADGFKAILGDFGLACLVDHKGEVVTTTPVGTLGYIAPEVLMEGRATEKSDVYSFGVLVFEVAYGRRVIGKRHTSNENPVNLLQWVWKVKESSQQLEALDPRMCIDTLPADQVEKWRNVLHVAFLCCDPSPEGRPTMREVSQTLQGGKQELLLKPLPSRPPLEIDFTTLMYVLNSTSDAFYFSALTSTFCGLSFSTSPPALCGLSTSTYSPISDIQSFSIEDIV